MKDVQRSITDFLSWMKHNGQRPAVFDNGILRSGGCEPLPALPDPGCCSELLDLTELEDALRALTS